MIIDFPGKEKEEEPTPEEIRDEILNGIQAILDVTNDELSYFVGIFGVKSGGYCMFQYPKNPEDPLTIIGALEVSKENIVSTMYEVEDDDILED